MKTIRRKRALLALAFVAMFVMGATAAVLSNQLVSTFNVISAEPFVLTLDLNPSGDLLVGKMATGTIGWSNPVAITYVTTLKIVVNAPITVLGIADLGNTLVLTVNGFTIVDWGMAGDFIASYDTGEIVGGGAGGSWDFTFQILEEAGKGLGVWTVSFQLESAPL